MKENKIDLYLHEYHKDILSYQKHINEGLITYNGFIIALSGVLIGFNDINKMSELCFILAIILIVIGLQSHFLKFNINFEKFQNNYMEEIKFRKPLKGEKKESIYEIILGYLMELQILGQAFFLFGMLLLVICSL